MIFFDQNFRLFLAWFFCKGALISVFACVFHDFHELFEPHASILKPYFSFPSQLLTDFGPEYSFLPHMIATFSAFAGFSMILSMQRD
jgi:hypothetical protein